MCLSCARGFTNECSCQGKASGGAKTLLEAFSSIGENNGRSETFNNEESSINSDQIKNVGRPRKESEDITDPKSTGRKRAAAMYPLDKLAFCEWRDLANCGGGKNPIIGCATGYQENLHHGPDKNTLNNTRSEDDVKSRNVHKICSKCHNRWHAANDYDYDPSIPHEPREAVFAERFSRLTQEMSEQKTK